MFMYVFHTLLMGLFTLSYFASKHAEFITQSNVKIASNGCVKNINTKGQIQDGINLTIIMGAVQVGSFIIIITLEELTPSLLH